MPNQLDDIENTEVRPPNESEMPIVSLTPEERAAIVESKDAAARGEFATDQEVRAVWAKHGR